MGYSIGMSDIAGIVMLAILGSLYEIPDKEKEER